MPAIDDDEIKIQHALPGRPQSPALERTARLAVEAAFGELISRKLLYQKVTIDLSGLSQAIASSELTTPDQLLPLETEVAARPWSLRRTTKAITRSIFRYSRQRMWAGSP